MYGIEVKQLTYKYFPGTPLETVALNKIDLTIDQGEFLALVGATGSGKSTLVQHFNGLLQPTSGEIRVLGRDVANPGYRSGLWRQVGMVFQYPERQVFSASVFDDVAFGPRNMGLADPVVTAMVNAALDQVDLPPEVGNRDPHSLSGGMQRRVAIAGVLAMEPEILILDEPGAGLEPGVKKGILDRIKQLQVQDRITVILVTHNLDDVAVYADRVAVLKGGELHLAGPPREILGRHQDALTATGLVPPLAVELHQKLARAGINLPEIPLTRAEVLDALCTLWPGQREKPGGD